MRIFHLSDTHFGNAAPMFPVHKLKGALSALITIENDPNSFLIISGDITYQGKSDGYKQAQSIIKEIWLDRGGKRDHFFACPGNHDICQGSFKSFDDFQYGIRRNDSAKFEKSSAHLISGDEVAFLLLNTAHHLDHKYGLLELNKIANLLEENSDILNKKIQKVAIIHHHLIGYDQEDLSTVRNALPFLKLLDEFGFNLILHGHRHSLAPITVGQAGIQIFSARSLNFPTLGIKNGVAIHEFKNNTWQTQHHTLSGDHHPINLTFRPEST
jgi:3',5'-cyclic AMP phosphodiesterase CpdA